MVRGEAAGRAVETGEPQQLVADRGEVAPRAGLALGEVVDGRRTRSARDAGRRPGRPPSSVASGSMSGAGSMSGRGDDDRPELPRREQLVRP